MAGLNGANPTGGGGRAAGSRALTGHQLFIANVKKIIANETTLYTPEQAGQFLQGVVNGFNFGWQSTLDMAASLPGLAQKAVPYIERYSGVLGTFYMGYDAATLEYRAAAWILGVDPIKDPAGAAQSAVEKAQAAARVVGEIGAIAGDFTISALQQSLDPNAPPTSLDTMVDTALDKALDAASPLTLSILNLAAQVVANITPYQRGYAQGFVVEQLLEQVALELATEGAAFVLKAAQVSERFAAALEKLESISSEAAKAFENVVAKLRTLVVEGKDAETLAKDIEAMTLDLEKSELKAAGLLDICVKDHCFAAGTPVLTSSGEKFIEDFEIGDEILTRPEDSPDAPVRASTVEKVFRLSGPTLELRVGGRTVVTTEKHPFYVLGRGWVWAAELQRGDMLLGDSGAATAVESIALTGRHESLYNLRVALDRTYFVGGRSWGFSLWVHNTYTAKLNTGTGRYEIWGVNEAGAPEVKAELLPGKTQADAERVVNEMNEVAAKQYAAVLERGKWVHESTAGWKPRAKAYQQQITKRPAGVAFELNGVNFDGVNAVGELIEAKGPGYGHLFDQGWAMDRVLKQARDQLQAARGVPIVWHVAEEDAAKAIRAEFRQNNLPIQVIYTKPVP